MQEVEIKVIESPELKELKEQYELERAEKDEKIAIMEKRMEEIEKKNKERDEFLDDLMTKKNVIRKVLEEVDK